MWGSHKRTCSKLKTIALGMVILDGYLPPQSSYSSMPCSHWPRDYRLTLTEETVKNVLFHIQCTVSSMDRGPAHTSFVDSSLLLPHMSLSSIIPTNASLINELLPKVQWVQIQMDPKVFLLSHHDRESGPVFSLKK